MILITAINGCGDQNEDQYFYTQYTLGTDWLGEIDLRFETYLSGTILLVDKPWILISGTYIK